MVLSTKRELEQAYDDERLTWLRRRFFMYAWISVALSTLSLIGAVVSLLQLASGMRDALADQTLLGSAVFWVSESLVTLATMLVFVAGILWVRREQPGRAGVIRLIYGLFVGSHLLGMAHILLLGLWIDPTAATGTMLDQSLIALFFTHFVAAIIIPWTLRESLQPMIPVVLVHAFLIALFATDPLGHRGFDLVVLVLIGLPGMGVCWLKQAWFERRFQFRSYREVYQYVSREVKQARALHESFFPEPITNGPLRLDYRYQPMSQLGGDYLHAYLYTEDGRPASLLCAVIDVTGHGLPATLTANHLHALLKRETQRSQRPDPGGLIEDLNRYMHESFSGLSVFATALCMRIDLDEQRVVWASAGHPPGFLVSAGHCEPALESTACLLGVIEPELYSANMRELSISTDVQVVAYTDGATELPLKGGGMLEIPGLAERIARLSQHDCLTSDALMADLERITTRERQDDILIVQLGLRAQLPQPSALEAVEAADIVPDHPAALST